jgi:O-antigen ligase
LLFLLPLVAINVVGVKDDEFLQERMEATNPIEARIGSIVTAVRIWRDYPLFGCGPYQFRHFMRDYVAPIEAPLYGTVQVRYFKKSGAHDMYIGPLAEDGAVGMLLQYLIYFTIVRVSLAKLSLRRQNDHFATYILPLFFGIYAIYFFGGLIISFRHLSILGSLFYMAAGITSGYTPEEAEESNSNNM